MPNRKRLNNQERNNQLRHNRQKILAGRSKREANGLTMQAPKPFRANNRKRG